jgi:hypothetical protein
MEREVVEGLGMRESEVKAGFDAQNKRNYGTDT